ncbi:MAG: hypothetical protein OXI11_03760 [Gammaproteobacteria bacterium]|nr:hypothetical protein [Gammaproteobacteria bacterium]MXW44861.1 hypothetical protein [Gammaproteobacteria bacterium]MYD02012.1 hypothetical protein [Gammaproteobacteria bacterium]MYI24057.1 hypothetical protein [Gammaproteobacteria bacterium]
MKAMKYWLIFPIVVGSLVLGGCKGKWSFECGVGDSGPWCKGGVEGSFVVDTGGETLSEVKARNHAIAEITKAISQYGSPYVTETPDWDTLNVSVQNGNTVKYSLGADASGPKSALDSSFSLASSWFDIDVNWLADPDDVDNPTAEQ